jgi:hypothetical protein
LQKGDKAGKEFVFRTRGLSLGHFGSSLYCALCTPGFQACSVRVLGEGSMTRMRHRVLALSAVQ